MMLALRRAQGRDPGSGTGHAVPPGDQGDAQGDAAGRRQAGDPVRRRGGGRRRPRGRAVHHRSQQASARGPLRPQLRARAGAPRQGRRRAAALVTESTDLARIHYVRQGDPLGLGHAVLMAESHVGNEPFAVLLGDDLIDPRDPVLDRMEEVRDRVRRLGDLPHAGADRDQIHLYGCPAVDADRRPRRRDASPTSSRSPTPTRRRATTRSSAATCSTPPCSTSSKSTPPGRGGEIQLTDALRTLASHARRGGRRGSRHRLPRPALRHRRPAVVPAGGHPPGLRARRHRSRPAGLAGRRSSRSSVVASAAGRSPSPRVT